MAYTRILVAYDGSEIGEKALVYGIQLAQLNRDAHLHVVHAVTVPHIFTVSEYLHVDKIREDVMAHGKVVLQSAIERLSLVSDSRYQVAIVEGKPADEILTYAREQKCDLILMGSRGLNQVQELFLGSVSHEIAQRSAVPVMIIK